VQAAGPGFGRFREVPGRFEGNFGSSSQAKVPGACCLSFICLQGLMSFVSFSFFSLHLSLGRLPAWVPVVRSPIMCLPIICLSVIWLSVISPQFLLPAWVASGRALRSLWLLIRSTSSTSSSFLFLLSCPSLRLVSPFISLFRYCDQKCISSFSGCCNQVVTALHMESDFLENFL